MKNVTDLGFLQIGTRKNKIFPDSKSCTLPINTSIFSVSRPRTSMKLGKV